MLYTITLNNVDFLSVYKNVHVWYTHFILITFAHIGSYTAQAFKGQKLMTGLEMREILLPPLYACEYGLLQSVHASTSPYFGLQFEIFTIYLCN